MTGIVRLVVNGEPLEVLAGASVAAAVAKLGVPFRRSRNGEPRAPLCGMGVCFECRVTVDGMLHLRSCLIEARTGMRVNTDD